MNETHQGSPFSYQIARVHVEKVGLLAVTATQEVCSTVILLEVKVGLGQGEGVQVLYILLMWVWK